MKDRLKKFREDHAEAIAFAMVVTGTSMIAVGVTMIVMDYRTTVTHANYTTFDDGRSIIETLKRNGHRETLVRIPND